MTTYYKIRKKSDPESYLKGTPAYFRYDKSGRIFSTRGQLRTFITGVINSYSEHTRRDLNDWEVVELEMRVADIKQLIDVMDPKKVWEMLKK